MPAKDKILIVEDEKGILSFMTTVLSSNGYDVISANSGAKAITMVTSHCPDLVILDLGLPDMDGVEVLRFIREWTHLPIIVVSARTHERDKVEALDLGADDYIAKPFGIMEFLARVRALLRRGEPKESLCIRGVLLYPAGRRVEAEGAEVQLTAKEFDLLEYLMRRAGAVVRREELLEAVWGYSGGEETRTVDVHIRSLRLKLGGCGAMIRTVRGVGYMVEA